MFVCFSSAILSLRDAGKRAIEDKKRNNLGGHHSDWSVIGFSQLLGLKISDE